MKKKVETTKFLILPGPKIIHQNSLKQELNKHLYWILVIENWKNAYSEAIKGQVFLAQLQMKMEDFIQEAVMAIYMHGMETLEKKLFLYTEALYNEWLIIKVQYLLEVGIGKL